MYNIIICGNDKKFYTYIQKLLFNRMNVNNKKCKFYCFKSIDELIDKLENKIDIDLLIYDMNYPIDMENKFLKTFRSYHPNSLLVLCSNSFCISSKTFENNIFRYILKDNGLEDIKHTVDEINNELISRKSSKILLKYRNKIIVINQMDILYAVIKKHGSEVIYFNRYKNIVDKFVCNKKLSELYKELNNKIFSYPHKSYFVNLFYISELRDFELILENGILLSISKSRKKFFEKDFLNIRG